MHQVLPEKEVSPLASASEISLLETGTELQPALAGWWIEMCVCVSVCDRQTHAWRRKRRRSRKKGLISSERHAANRQRAKKKNRITRLEPDSTS